MVVKRKIINMQNDDKTKLLLWLIFIAGVLLFTFITKLITKNNVSNDRNESNETIDITVREDFNKVKELLNKHNYEYKIIVKNNNETTTYFGKTLYEETVGYKESSLGIQKYYINENTVYELANNNKIMEISLENMIYDHNLDISSILDNLEDKDIQEIDNSLIYNDNIYDIKIKKDDLKIEINILNENKEYSFIYTNIGLINSIE